MTRINFIIHILLYFAAATGFIPLAPYLGPVPMVTVPAALIFAALADRSNMVVKERPAMFLSIAWALYYAAQFNRHNVVQPAAEMLVIFLAIRLIGEKSPRNVMQALTLSMFCLAASTLFNLSPAFIFYMITLLLLFTVIMVLLTFQSKGVGFEPNSKEISSIIKVALLLPLVASPLVLLLFIILPRTQLPLWQGISRAGTDKPGISEQVKAGEKSSINSGSSVVFRAEMLKQPLHNLYWRTIVLNSIKGDNWYRIPPPDEKSSVRRSNPGVSVNIYLEPGRLAYLPTLNIPDKIIAYRSQPSSDRVFPSQGLPPGRKNYQTLSYPEGRLATIGTLNRQFYMTLPEHTPLRLRSLIAKKVSGINSDRKKLEAVEDIFAASNLSYASSGLPIGPEALDQFLFSDRKGHCELFAVSFATALRLAGLPTRLVGGYCGGSYNEIANYYVITEDRAHVWVEVWIQGEGWVNIDPSRYAVNFEESILQKESAPDLKIRLILDSLSYYWNRMVITYDFENQFNAVSRAGTSFRNLKEMKIPFKSIIISLAGIFLAGFGISLLTDRKSPEQRLLERFKKTILAGYGVVIEPTSGLHEATASIHDENVKEFVTILTGALYRDRQLNSMEKRTLYRLLEQIQMTIKSRL